MSEEPREVMHKMLLGFANDPPDNDFQQGFMEGLVTFALEGLGMKYEEVTEPQEAKPVRRGFAIIQGGKEP